MTKIGFTVPAWTFFAKPIIRATKCNDILPFVILIDGGIKTTLLITQHVRRKVRNVNIIVIAIHKMITCWTQALPPSISQLPFGLRMSQLRFF
ncbi:hypothetical protein ADJ79_01375 [Ottowia sp. oral taxon 894]|nr:hypothetical protein ADJ79_01375 [Ottowia sp. oral taxon 894]